MRNLKLLLSLATCAVVVYATQADVLENPGGFEYVNTALTAISLVSAASNIILSVDPKTLPEQKNQDFLLKLQTILYTLRTKGITLKGAYVVDFFKGIYASFPEEWATKDQQNGSKFYQSLVRTIEKNLLPSDKRATFHDLLNVKQEVTSTSGTTIEDSLVINVSGTLGTVQAGLDEYFGAQTAVSSTGNPPPQHRIAADPSVLAIYVDTLPTYTTEDGKQGISTPCGNIDIKNYRTASLAQNPSSHYVAKYVATSCKNPSANSRYHGYKQNGVERITSDDSNGSGNETSSPCQELAALLYYINTKQAADLQKENPVPSNVMALIDGELAKHATIEKKTSWLASNNSASRLTCGLFPLLSAAVIIFYLAK